MAELNEMTNAPLEICLNGTSLKARRPNLEDVFGIMESKIVSGEIRKIKEAAETFGLEDASKIEFLRQSLQDIPKGASLQTMVWERIGTPEGIALIIFHAVKRDQPEVSKDKISELVASDVPGATAWAEFLCGASKKAPAAKMEEVSQ